jgi:lipoprotein-releasing system ATP-binding protein
MTTSALHLQNITRTYTQGGHDLHVLKSLELDIKAGEVVALVGPSGSGKTTLLQIAGLLDTPTSGEVFIAGEKLTGANDSLRTQARRTHIGFVYQFHHLLPEFTALENASMPLLISGVEQKIAYAKAAEILTQLGLGERLLHRPAKLSGGEQQRVAIARALVHEPALVLADEPTGNLDPHTAEEVFSLFMQLAKKRGQAALVATHNHDLAKRMNRVVHLAGGRVLQEAA